MKTRFQTWKSPAFKSCAVCAAAWALTLSITSAAEEAARKAEADKPKADEKSEADYRNWIELGVGGTWLKDNGARFQQRQNLRNGAFGGIQDFHYEQDVGKKGILQVDGRGMFDNNDYSLRFSLDNPDKGYLRGGYRESRSWFDGSGGFFPKGNLWLPVYDDDLTVDRGEAWFEGGLTLPGKPVFTFRYSHQFRDGVKDSTSWGDSTLTGGSGARGIVPTFLNIDEQRDIFQGNVRHAFGKTDVGLGLRFETSSQDNSRNIRWNPGEAKNGYTTQRDKVDSDLFSVHAFSESRLNEKFLLTSGYSFTTLDSDISGYRVYGPSYDPDFAQRLPSPDSFDGLVGGSQLQQHVVNLNLMWNLTDRLFLIPSLRVEKQDSDSESFFDSPAAPFSSYPYGGASDRGLLDVSQSLELRYTGLTNWVFSARGYWLEGSGDLDQRLDNLGTRANVFSRSTDDTRFWQKYSVGANWYPLRKLNFASEYYHKQRSNDFEHETDSTRNLPASPIRYPAFLRAHDFDTDDVNFRATWRPLANLTLVGRYDFQFSTIDVTADNLARTQSSEMTSHIVSGSISWTPVSRLYLLGGINWVSDKTDTPADEITAAIQESKNNYWTANASIGCVLDEKTDWETQYSYYRADNFADNSTAGMPYGAGAEEHGITTGLKRRISARMQVALKYGYFEGRDETSGHNNDYQAHLVYSSFRYRF